MLKRRHENSHRESTETTPAARKATPRKRHAGVYAHQIIVTKIISERQYSPTNVTRFVQYPRFLNNELVLGRLICILSQILMKPRKQSKLEGKRDVNFHTI
ncbi:MAG: hypothetical protein GY819_14310 [Planctomycetaceae bacterium]|nr:hypothetical protein [Planctomycetaceae bacterium]MCP4463962.1 hypothetical protein [Planctomycetaceae bacterium]MDG2105132.1 hypothetical protein [Pirellulaceae bacterium]